MKETEGGMGMHRLLVLFLITSLGAAGCATKGDLDKLKDEVLQEIRRTDAQNQMQFQRTDTQIRGVSQEVQTLKKDLESQTETVNNRVTRAEQRIMEVGAIRERLKTIGETLKKVGDVFKGIE
jgi:TolA-binding protein